MNETLSQLPAGAFGPLDDAAEEALRANLGIWARHVSKNRVKEQYYHGRSRKVTRSAGMPSELQRLDVCVGWGAKAVDVMAARSVFEGFTAQGAVVDELAAACGDLRERYQQAVTSELITSCCFMTVTAGDTGSGEPPVVVSVHGALDAAGRWDTRRNRIRDGLVVMDTVENPGGTIAPTMASLFMSDATYTCRLGRNGKWVAQKAPNTYGRPLIEPLRYDPNPTDQRPFGKSRLTRTVRSLIDRATAVAARTETSATFYTWPLRYMLNVDKQTAQDAAKRKIEMYTDTWLLASTNKNGDSPQVGQLAQMTMQPHLDQFEMLAKQFASETSIPLDEVGVVFDNPASSEAMHAAQQRLIVEVEKLNRGNAVALENVARMVIAISRGLESLDELGDDARSIRAVFADPVRSSRAASADAAAKLAAVVDGYASTRQFWHDMGYSEDEITSVMRELRRARAVSAAAARAVAGQAGDGKAPGEARGVRASASPDHGEEAEAARDD